MFCYPSGNEPKREKIVFVGETEKVTWAFFGGGMLFFGT